MAQKTGVRTVKRAKAATSSLAAKLRQHLVLRLQAEAVQARADALKAELAAAIETQGYADDKGHQWLDLDEEVTVDGWGTCRRLQRQCRVSQPMDEDAVEAISAKKGLWVDAEEGGILTTIVVVDEDALRKAYFEGKYTKAEFEKMFPRKISWAFLPVKS